MESQSSFSSHTSTSAKFFLDRGMGRAPVYLRITVPLFYRGRKIQRWEGTKSQWRKRRAVERVHARPARQGRPNGRLRAPAGPRRNNRARICDAGGETPAERVMRLDGVARGGWWPLSLRAVLRVLFFVVQQLSVATGTFLLSHRHLRQIPPPTRGLLNKTPETFTHNRRSEGFP